jgi:hypothetical protein
MDQNENRPRLDVSTFIPLGVGVVSLFGICLILIAGRLAAPRSTVQVPDTATPFRYLFLGTEPGALSAVPGEEGEFLDPNASMRTPQIGLAITAQSGFADPNSVPVTITRAVSTRPATEDPNAIFTVIVTPTLNAGIPLSTQPPTRMRITNTPIDLGPLPATNTGSTPTRTITPTRTPTSASGPPLNPGTYDDTDSRLLYTGNWSSQDNVAGAEQNSLHVSTTLGNSVTFRFIGNQIRIFYQPGGSLGQLAILVDGQTPDNSPLNQSNTSARELLIDDLTNGTHTIVLTHLSGGSVNIDQIIIPDVATTPTPTSTATATSTP